MHWGKHRKRGGVVTLALADIVLYNDGEQGETKQWPAIVSDYKQGDEGESRWLLTVFRPRGIFWVWVDNEPGVAWGQWCEKPQTIVDEFALRTAEVEPLGVVDNG